MQGKKEHFTYEDFKGCEKRIDLVRGRAEGIVIEVCLGVKCWKQTASEVGIEEERIESIYFNFVCCKASYMKLYNKRTQ